MEKKDIESAFSELLLFLKNRGLGYYCPGNSNLQVLTAMGTIKPSYCVPDTMKAGVEALQGKVPALIAGFKGLKEFSSTQIKETLSGEWPLLRSIQLNFPGTEGTRKLFTSHLAGYLDNPQTAGLLAEMIKNEIREEKAVGLPAVLGTLKCAEIHKKLEKEIGLPVFEIPTMPGSVPGMRLRDAFSKGLSEMGIKRLSGKKIISASYEDGRGFILKTGREKNETVIISKYIILASGRFLGGGLTADRNGISESIFSLPIASPESRAQWHNDRFFAEKSHPVNLAGIETDKHLSPVDKSGKILYKNLFAAGSILAHQDWKRMKCGAGLSISTAYKAVNSIVKPGN